MHAWTDILGHLRLPGEPERHRLLLLRGEPSRPSIRMIRANGGMISKVLRRDVEGVLDY